jgi:hypothetical protein
MTRCARACMRAGRGCESRAGAAGSAPSARRCARRGPWPTTTRARAGRARGDGGGRPHARARAGLAGRGRAGGAGGAVRGRRGLPRVARAEGRHRAHDGAAQGPAPAGLARPARRPSGPRGPAAAARACSACLCACSHCLPGHAASNVHPWQRASAWSTRRLCHAAGCPARDARATAGAHAAGARAWRAAARARRALAHAGHRRRRQRRGHDPGASAGCQVRGCPRAWKGRVRAFFL